MCDRTHRPIGDRNLGLNYAPFFEYNNPKVTWGPSSTHTDGATHLMGDGSVHFLTNEMQALVYLALSTRAGGEVLPKSEF